MRWAQWDGEPERLDRVLADLGLARSRSQAAELVIQGCVRVGNRTVEKPSTRVATGKKVTVVGGSETRFVSRAAHKLVAGLDAFQIGVKHSCALDLGASTGGFTQVLLQREAREVIALDVGHGQLDLSLRRNERVRVVEGCNARYLDRANLTMLAGSACPVNLIVGDLSFISLTLIFPAMRRVSEPDTQAVMLIKPQFEVEKIFRSRGIVRDLSVHAQAVRRVLQAAAEQGFFLRGLCPSPIAGQHGNREYLVHLVSNPQPDPTEWEATIAQAIGKNIDDNNGGMAVKEG